GAKLGIGNDNDSLTDAQRSELANFGLQHTKTVAAMHNVAKQQAIGQYSMNPYADASKAGTFQQSLGAPLDAHIQQLQESFGKYAKTPEAAGQGQVAQQNPQQGLIPKAFSGLHSLLFGGGKPPAQQ